MYAGIDIGGSTIKLGLLDCKGLLLARHHVSIDAHSIDPVKVVSISYDMLQKQLKMLKQCVTAIRAVGIGCPGELLEGGVLRAAANFPNWKNVPLESLFHDTFQLPTTICNDADAAVLAEEWVGAAKNGVCNFIMLTLGTGIGVGVIINNQLVHGANHLIEGGHMIVEKNGRLCGCSQRGCLEAYASAKALVQEVNSEIRNGRTSMISHIPSEALAAEHIFQYAKKGDELCLKAIAMAADYLGFACVNFSRILDPELILFSGGLAEAGDLFIQMIRNAYKEYSWKTYPNNTQIKKSDLGYDAGIIGAAAAAHFGMR